MINYRMKEAQRSPGSLRCNKTRREPPLNSVRMRGLMLLTEIAARNLHKWRNQTSGVWTVRATDLLEQPTFAHEDGNAIICALQYIADCRETWPKLAAGERITVVPKRGGRGRKKAQQAEAVPA